MSRTTHIIVLCTLWLLGALVGGLIGWNLKTTEPAMYFPPEQAVQRATCQPTDILYYYSGTGTYICVPKDAKIQSRP